MGTGEAGTPTKSVKTSTVQEQLSTPSYSEWAAAFQAYYGSGTAPPPPGFFSPTVASGPQPHPYLWGGQPLMPSYGTPPPHAALYSYNGIYAHPTMPPGAHPYGQYGMPSPGTEITMATTHASTETEVKSSGGKDRMSMKRSKGSLGSLGMSTGKARESAKAMLGSDADGHTQSRESGVEGSSEDSEDTTQNLTQKGSFEQLEMDGVVAHGSNMPSGDAYMSQGGHVVGNPVNQSVAVTQAAIIGRPAAGTGPATNLNIGMDYWPGTTAAPVTTFKGKNNSPNIPTSVTQACQSTQHMASSHEGMPPDLWLQSQDDREVKRQRRKQSNRESARRSRLRKQAECEELNTKVDALSVENMALRTELNRLAEECKKLSSENASLLEQLQNLPGEEDTMGTQDREIIRHENQSALSGRKTPDQNGKNYSNGNIWPRSNDKSKTGFDPTGKVPSCHNSTGYSDAVAAG